MTLTDEALLAAVADSPFERGAVRAQSVGAPDVELEAEVSAAIALLEVDAGSFEVIEGEDTWRVVIMEAE